MSTSGLIHACGALSHFLCTIGVQSPAEAVAALALNPLSVRQYVEFHIEQGPQLEAAGLPLGVVSGIAGQTWLSIAIEGVQNHGGGSQSACLQLKMA